MNKRNQSSAVKAAAQTPVLPVKIVIAYCARCGKPIYTGQPWRRIKSEDDSYAVRVHTDCPVASA
jgi:hypothetical protein